MAKFEYFTHPNRPVSATYEGDYMEQDKDYVKIFKHNADKADAFAMPELVVAIHLDKGNVVKKV